MQNENYSLVINSQTDTSIITNNTNLSAYQYNINWQSILPTKYKRFTVTFQCKSANSSTVLFTGTQTANVLTVINPIYGRIHIGMQYLNNNSVGTILSFGTGTGLAGDYNISTVNVNATNTLLFSMNSIFSSNVICSINFGSNNTVQNNSASDKLGALFPYSYPVLTNTSGTISTSNLACGTADNGPIEIIYPTNNNITVSFTNIDGTPFTRMTHYNLQLYFTPIE